MTERAQRQNQVHVCTDEPGSPPLKVKCDKPQELFDLLVRQVHPHRYYRIEQYDGLGNLERVYETG